MKKTWLNAEVEELAVEMTANGQAPNDNFDGDWVQIGGLYYRPGDGSSPSVDPLS